MRAFVAGATGFTGRAVVEALCAEGVECLAHVRPDSARLEEHRARFETLGASVDTTAWDLAALTATFTRQPPDLIFALLGTTRKRMKQDAASYESVDYGLTVMLIDAAGAAGISPRVVYLSSIGVRPGTRNAYLGARARVEAHLRQSGLPFVIARPSFITGDRDERRPGEHIGAAVGDALLGLAGVLGGRRLRARYASTDDRTLAAALVRLALDPEAADTVAEGAALR